MIIGNGLIATSLKNIDSGNIIFFASGVSNSLETRNSEFEREFSLLKDCIRQNPEKKFIYFSTVSINDQSKQDSLYILHKLNIENYIKNTCKNYLILRIGNIVGKGGNPNTLFNFLTTQISENRRFFLHRKAKRLLIDMDDISRFLALHCNTIKNETINCAYPYHYDLKEIIQEIEKQVGKLADYTEIDEGDFYQISFNTYFKSFFTGINPDDYLKGLVKKYI
ncbi:hypothetical protein N0B16_07380 [Chryseobacterium sp. GMJ5]|uniref:NAD-dependent epimerase/dehydratase domain-containing protein n=1 Tax=Chryseobacterium gilvum TaxID=2976534 RepID=A0ABT2VYV0_9FLAO|nr:NAD-dependent epimerase/dehydratase family protein [Chryseobacterium gilvum]MCU7614254.1 hypothetical protein [Chryseobacterium gilvum]